MSYEPTPSGLLLPVDRRRDRRQAEQPADNLGTDYLPGGATVSQRAVQMGRQGWRHEVSATWPARDDDGQAVQRTDVLWLLDALDAARLRRAAGDRLRAVGSVTLSELARELRLQLPRN